MLGLLLLMLHALAGPEAHTRTARAVALEIVEVVDAADPVFESAEADAAVMAEMAFRESSLGRFVIGDGGVAHCAYQLHNAPERVRTDLHACTALAYARLRASAVACPGAPLAVYVSGSCTNRGGRAVSAFRMAEARRIQVAAASRGTP